jgi:uncharacterized protein YcnI
MFRKLSSAIAAIAIITLPALASAHVIVTPGTADVGQELIFNVSVPNERDTPVTNIKLDIPSGVSEVTPTEKDGWSIQTTTSGTGDNEEVTSITWTGSQIPVGQREDFSFGAQVPGTAGQLDWKAYQTYGDGTIVHWDQTPAGSDDATGNAGPYSVTKVANDLTGTSATSTTSSSSNTPAVVISLAALVIAIGGILFRKK